GGFENTLELISGGDPAPTEDVLADGLDAAKEHIRNLCDLQRELVAQCEIPRRQWIETRDYEQDLLDRIADGYGDRVKQALTIVGKQDRNDALDEIGAEVTEKFGAELPEERAVEIKPALRALQKKIV